MVPIVVGLTPRTDYASAARSERFLRTVGQITERFQRDLEHADLRHADAYAVRLRGITTTVVPAGKPGSKPR